MFSVRLSARRSIIGNQSTASGWVSMQFDIDIFFDNPSRILKLHSDIATILGALHEDQYIFLIVSVSVLLGLRKFSKNYS